MSNNIYNSIRYAMMTGAFDWRALDLRVVLLSGEPDFDPTDITLNDIIGRGGAVRAVSQPVTAPSVVVDGTGRTDAVLVEEVPIGDPITWLLLVKYNPVQNSSQLVYFCDEALDIPFIPNGLDMIIQPDWTAQRGWFKP